MERKRLETPKKTEHTPAANRARLTRALRCRNHIDAAARRISNKDVDRLVGVVRGRAGFAGRGTQRKRAGARKHMASCQHRDSSRFVFY